MACARLSIWSYKAMHFADGGFRSDAVRETESPLGSKASASRGRCHADAAVARGLRTGAGKRGESEERRRTAPKDGVHLHAARAAPAVLLSGEGWFGLCADPVPGAAEGPPPGLHGHLRALASGYRLQPRLDLQLADRRAPPGAPRRFQEQHLPRSTRRGEARRRDA